MTETFQLLTEVCGGDCKSRARVFEWHKRFSEGTESVEDDDLPGRPRTAVTDDNTEKERDVIRKDRRLDVRAVAEEVSLDGESVRRILRDELNMRKLCAKMVPELSDEKKNVARNCVLTFCNALRMNQIC